MATPPIILIGMKSSGKTSVGKAVAEKLGLRFTDVDTEIERLHAESKGEHLPFREIFRKYGKEYFRSLETGTLNSLAAAAARAPFVLATGGGLPLAEENRVVLRPMGVIVFLDVPQEVLLRRILRNGVPAFFPYPEDPARSLAELLEARRPVYKALAQITFECGFGSADAEANALINKLETLPREN